MKSMWVGPRSVITSLFTTMLFQVPSTQVQHMQVSSQRTWSNTRPSAMSPFPLVLQDSSFHPQVTSFYKSLTLSFVYDKPSFYKRDPIFSRKPSFSIETRLQRIPSLEDLFFLIEPFERPTKFTRYNLK